MKCKKPILFLTLAAVLLLGVAVFLLQNRTFVPFADLTEDRVQEVAYLASNGEWKPLSEEDSRRLIQGLRVIKVRKKGEDLGPILGGAPSIRVTAVDRTQYVIYAHPGVEFGLGHRAKHTGSLVIGKTFYKAAGRESVSAIWALNEIQNSLPDQAPCG